MKRAKMIELLTETFINAGETKQVADKKASLLFSLIEKVRIDSSKIKKPKKLKKLAT